VLDGLALRVEDASFQRDPDAGLHENLEAVSS
jgi:hypothetical protein